MVNAMTSYWEITPEDLVEHIVYAIANGDVAGRDALRLVGGWRALRALTRAA
jgi:hypothetical protein